MKGVVLLLLLAVVAVSAVVDHNLHGNAEEHWRAFVAKYNKNYDPQEIPSRFRIFKHNLKTIDNLNKKDPSANFAINKFADLSAREMSFRYKMPNFHPKYTDDLYAPIQDSVSVIPDAYDWRDQKVITAVKDQGQCGSCWAFSVTEEIESQWIRKGNAAVELAPQQIVDCDTVDEGCNGGDTPTAYQYVIKAGGMQAEATYPYLAKDHKCTFNTTDVVAKISGWQYVVRKKNETEMLGALASAPLSICVDASTWDFYSGGVISTNCAHELDHCVQAVGYGTDATTGKQFWNVRNSWGLDWGEKGYIRIERDQGNLCGIASEVTIAVV